jgi:hypothetical protein
MLISAVMTAAMNNIIKYTRKTTNVSVVQALIIRALFLGTGTFIHLKKDKVNIIQIP